MHPGASSALKEVDGGRIRGLPVFTDVYLFANITTMD